MSTNRPTLVKEPPLDESKAPIENALELTELCIIGPVSFPLIMTAYHKIRSRSVGRGGMVEILDAGDPSDETN